MAKAQSFFIPFCLPGLNAIVAAAKVRAGKWSLYAQLKAKTQGDILAVLKQAKIKPVKGSVTLTFTWREPNQRRDVDNVAAGKKFLLDVLVEAKILESDGWAHVKGFQDEFCLNPNAPGVQVVIQSISNGSRA